LNNPVTGIARQCTSTGRQSS